MKKMLVVVLVLLTAIGCSKVKENKLQGKWYQKTPVNYTNDSLVVKFICDSFYITLYRFVDTTGFLNDPCIRPLVVEFASGSYFFSNKMVTLQGLFCDSSFTPKNPNVITCFSIGEYFQECNLRFKGQVLELYPHQYIPYKPEGEYLQFQKIEDYPNCK